MERITKDYYLVSGKLWRKVYYEDGKPRRSNGPAQILYYENGVVDCEFYYVNGKRHREDGPALIIYNEDGNVLYEEYWLNGIQYEDIFKWMVVVGSIEVI